MNSRLTRRDLLKQSLLGAAAANTIACKNDSRQYRVNLICSGMMAFFSHEATSMLEILVPKPLMADVPVHLVRFGEIGGVALPGVMGAGKPTTYQLGLPGIKAGNKVKRPHQSGVELAFKHVEGYDFVPNPVGIYCSILVPMPTAMEDPKNVRNLRPSKPTDGLPLYGLPPYASEQPESVPSVVVLTFDGVKGPVTLTDSKDWVMTFPRDSEVLNIHLYSEPPIVPCGTMNHLPLFNQLVYRVDTSNAGVPIPLNITQSSTHSSELEISDPKLVVPPDLSRYDLATLAEIGVRLGSFPAPAPVSVPGTSKECKVYSPADCVNGWVYGS